jgi:hypothetical protein
MGKKLIKISKIGIEDGCPGKGDIEWVEGGKNGLALSSKWSISFSKTGRNWSYNRLLSTEG